MKNYKKLYLQYLNDSFDLECLKLKKNSTSQERAKKLLELIKGRHSHSELGNLTQNLQGMGEGIHIDYMHFDILERAKEYGLIKTILNNAKYSKYKNKELALERVEEQIIEDYWQIMALNIIYLANHKPI